MASVDDLYAVPPQEFVAARDELVRELRASGDRDAAAEIKALRRPSPSAWALNQLVRRHRDEVEALLEAGGALRAAQRRAMSGVKDSGFREAATRRRQLVLELTKRAAGILGELGRAGGEDDLGRSLEAASVDEAAAAALLEGRLTREIDASSGFETVQGLGVVETAAEDDDAEREAREVAIRNAERQAAEAEAEARRAAMRADALEQQAEDIARRAREARAEAEELERAAEKARKRLEEVRQGSP